MKNEMFLMKSVIVNDSRELNNIQVLVLNMQLKIVSLAGTMGNSMEVPQKAERKKKKKSYHRIQQFHS